MVHYLRHKEIDKAKWDNCISGSASELIYAYSWYLDIVSPGWDALVEDDYVTVMPLTWRKKFGFFYLYQPYFTQQLGVFSINQINKDSVKTFLNEIPGKFKFIQISLNKSNTPDNSLFDINLNSNFELVLTPSYDEIYNSYSRNCKRNIKKAVNEGLTVNSNVSIPQFTGFLRENLEEKLTELSRDNYLTLENILKTTIKNKTGKIYGVFTKENDLCAIGSFLLSSKRCIFSVCASSEYGKSFQAMSLLVNHEINNNAGKNMIFDFSGSNIKGIAYFNSTFGAKQVEYPNIYRNNLPWFIKFLK